MIMTTDSTIRRVYVLCCFLKETATTTIYRYCHTLSLQAALPIDPLATASQWAAWRQDAPPVVIDSAPPRLAAKIEQATGQGAAFIVIDTPPHADSAAS